MNDQTLEEMEPLPPQTSTPAGSHTAQRLFSAVASPVQPVPPVVSEELPVSQQISIVTEMISQIATQIGSLQTQLTNLTTEVIKLTEKQSTAENVTISDSTLPPNDPSVMVMQSDGNPLPAPQKKAPKPKSKVPTAAQSHDNVPPAPQKENDPEPKSKDPKPVEIPTSNSKPNNRENQNQRQKPTKTLIIGDSILSGIKRKGLRNHVECRTLPGATVLDVHGKIKIFDLKQFESIIIYVGGNDASQDTDSELFEERYEQLIMYVKKENAECKIFICNSCPRGDVNVQDFNNIIGRQCSTHGVKLIDTHSAYFDKEGLLRSYFYRPRDNIHMSSSGTKRLLGTINNYVQIVEDFDKCAYDANKNAQITHPTAHPTTSQPSNRMSANQNNAPFTMQGNYGRNVRQQSNRPRENQPYDDRPRPNKENAGERCMKCGLTNHTTIECRHKHQIQCYNCKFMGHKDYLCWNV